MDDPYDVDSTKRQSSNFNQRQQRLLWESGFFDVLRNLKIISFVTSDEERVRFATSQIHVWSQMGDSKSFRWKTYSLKVMDLCTAT
jgi:hypothetical protein